MCGRKCGSAPKRWAWPKSCLNATRRNRLDSPAPDPVSCWAPRMDARETVTEQTVSNQDRRRAYAFIVAMGLVSFFGDITYEGARGITGPFLATLGASG